MMMAPEHDCAGNDQRPANGAQHDGGGGATIGTATLPGGTGEVTSLVVHVRENGVVQAGDTANHAGEPTEQRGKERHPEVTPAPLGSWRNHPGHGW